MTAKTMRQYLINRGYRYPSVFYEKNYTEGNRGFAHVQYFVDPGRLYVLDSVRFDCRDTAIQYLLNDISDKSFLKRGIPLSANLLDNERRRITESLNNFGYARFTPNFVLPFDADTLNTGFDALGNRRVNVVLRVERPNANSNHKKFNIADVIIYPNFDARLGETIARDTIVDGKIFFTYDGKLGIKPSSLSSAVRILPSDLYRKETIDKTFKQLNNLGIYKFVNIKGDEETCDSTLITYKVYLTPSKKMSLEGGIELNYSNITSTLQNNNLARFGLAVDMGFTHKNLLGGAEKFTTRLFAGIDQGLSRDFRIDNALSIPKFINLTNSFKLYNKIGILPNRFYQKLKENAKTDLGISYVFSDRTDQFRIQNFLLNHRYNLLSDNGLSRFSLSQTSVELQLSELRPRFIELIVSKNPRLENSLQSQLSTGFLFSSINYNYSGRTNVLGETNSFTANITQSGAEVLLGEKLFSANSWRISGAQLEFAKYLRGEFSWRYTRQISEKKAFDSRFTLGLATPFGNSTAVPFAKQFFVGGPNSLRAWRVNALGPGNYADPNADSSIVNQFQTGDIKIEFISEFRFPVIWLLQSAIFLDVGNVWTLDDDPNRPGSRFNKFWYNDLAIGTGIGLRFDVKYTIIRFDLGYRLRNPFINQEGKRWFPYRKVGLDNINFNFALGLPF
ncbi:MAG: BamA/TamA family outer membrane protein [Saprospiraceae bacterium]|nr:BamA/TamA family outer membrane protein [Saprospiraceae bacterium]